MLERKNIYEMRYWPTTKEGTEGRIHRLEDMKLFKEFHSGIPLSVRNKKVRKLEYLESCKDLEGYYAKIYYIVLNMLSEPRGYIMDEIKGKAFEGYYFNEKELLDILQQIKEIVLKKFYDENGILYLDLREPNIKIDHDNSPILLDMDNIQTEEESLDVTPTLLKHYILRGGKRDKNALILMLNDLTRRFLEEEEYTVDSEVTAFQNNLDIYFPDTMYDHELLMDHIIDIKKPMQKKNS